MVDATPPPSSSPAHHSTGVSSEKDIASVKRVPEVTLYLWQSILNLRPFKVQENCLVRSPSKSLPQRAAEQQAQGHCETSPLRVPINVKTQNAESRGGRGLRRGQEGPEEPAAQLVSGPFSHAQTTASRSSLLRVCLLQLWLEYDTLFPNGLLNSSAVASGHATDARGYLSLGRYRIRSCRSWGSCLRHISCALFQAYLNDHSTFIRYGRFSFLACVCLRPFGLPERSEGVSC